MQDRPRRIRVKVNAGARSDSVRLLGPDFYQVRTRVPPERGRANRRVLELLAQELGVPVERLQIVAGHTRPLKVVTLV